MDLRTLDTRELSWDCSGLNAATSPFVDKGNEIKLDFGKASVNCEISIPSGAQVVLEGGNSKLNIEEPTFHLKANLTNAAVDFEPEKEKS